MKFPASGITEDHGRGGATGAQGVAGAQGPPGVGANWRGVWSNATTYAVGDGVSRSGSNYISVAAGNLNHDPATDSTNTYWSPLLPNAVATDSQLGIFNVIKYGAVGNGTTDDAVAVQAAHDALKTAGAGILYFPPTASMTYLLNGAHTVAGVSWAVALSADNIKVLAPGITFKTTINAATFFFGGALKPAGAANWSSNRVSGSSGLAIKTINGPVAQGATSITCTTAADAGIFAAGDWIYIRTGECVTGAFPQSNPTEPDAEINQVLSANAGTGVVVLRWPVLKAFAKEYFPNAGSLGPTTTTVTAYPAPFGVSKITDRIQQNVTFEGGRFRHSGDAVTGSGPIACALLGVGGIYGLKTRFDPGSLIGGAFTQIIEARNVDYDHSCHFTSEAPSLAYHTIANADTGSSDIRMKVMASAEQGAATIEMHEGCADITLSSPLLMNPVSDPTVYPSLHCAGRVYDVTMIAPIVVNGGAGGGIAVDNSCPGGGRILAPRMVGTFPMPAGCINISSPGWMVRDWSAPDGIAVNINGSSVYNRAPLTPIRTEELTAFVDFGDTDVRLGPLPYTCYVKAVRIQTIGAFNGGTNVINVGVPTVHAIFAAVDVTAAGIKAAVAGAGYLSGFFYDVHAYYVQTGAVATQGRALVTIEYVPSLTQ